MPLIFIEGDATYPINVDYTTRYIIHCCNDIGAWGSGFVLSLSKRWKEPEAKYREWYAKGVTDGGEPFQLGEIQFVPVAGNNSGEIVVVNMICQHGIKSKSNISPIRYDAVEKALGQLRHTIQTLNWFDPSSVHAPRFGAGRAGGDWCHIQALIEKELVSHSIPVVIYSI
jgi:hypothetical protein